MGAPVAPSLSPAATVPQAQLVVLKTLMATVARSRCNRERAALLF